MAVTRGELKAELARRRAASGVSQPVGESSSGEQTVTRGDLKLEQERRRMTATPVAPTPVNNDQQAVQTFEDLVGQQTGKPLDVRGMAGEKLDTVQMLMNVPDSAAKFGENLIAPILSPVKTANTLQSLGQGLVEKAIPSQIDGTEFGATQNEKVVDAVGQFIESRYGSSDAFRKTITEDPVGVFADFAGLVSGGSLLLPKTAGLRQAVQAIGKAADPINLTISGAKAFAKAGGSVIPAAVPAKLLESALKFRPSLKPAQRAAMTATALREGIMPTVGGLRKITDKLDELDTGLNQIITEATTRGGKVPAGMVFSGLKELRQKLGGPKLNAQSDLRIIDAVAKDFALHLRKLGKKTLTPSELQALKTDAYNRIKFDMQQGSASFAKNEATKSIASQARQGIEKFDPSVKPTNRRMGDLLELRPEMERAVARLDNRNLISLDSAAKVGAGASTGTNTGTAAGVSAAVLGHPRLKARIALTLENLRTNSETIQIANNRLTPVLARAVATQAARIEQALQDELSVDSVD